MKVKVEAKVKGGRWTATGIVGTLLLMCAASVFSEEPQPRPQPQPALSPERHLANIRQLTVGRKNAEAYFSFDGTKLIFQSTNDWSDQTGDRTIPMPASSSKGLGCYQMYVMDLITETIRMVSTGVGATTCGYFFPGDRRVLFSSTHPVSPQCPPAPKREGRYRWALDDYDIFAMRVDGQGVHRLTHARGYDAEATISPDGKTIVYTSMMGGDLDIYAMDLDGRHVRRLTTELGYDGGAFFSPDSKRIVYRAAHPTDQTALAEYQTLLKQNLVEPGHLEIYVMNADGSDKRQVTKNGASNFAPFFHPDGRRIIFSSSLSAPGTQSFDKLRTPSPAEGHSAPGTQQPAFHLYLVGDDGSGLEQITTQGHFNSFPMFSPDGKKLVWISDRDATERREFNIFLADWVP